MSTAVGTIPSKTPCQGPALLSAVPSSVVPCTLLELESGPGQLISLADLLVGGL